MSRSIFISKNASEVSVLKNFCDSNNFNLLAESLIQFTPIDFTIECEFDVIFFNSPRSVTFFLSKFSIPKNIALACVGQKSKQLLESMGYQVGFSDYSSDPKEVATNFKSWLGNRFVLFPLSTKSLRSISLQLPMSQFKEVEVYETTLACKQIPVQDVYVFSSPSNVESFFLHNEIPNEAKVIAWGTSTESALLKKNSSPIAMKEPSISYLIDLLKELY